MTATRLKTLLGDYPVTSALKRGEVSSSRVTLDFADVKVPNTAFKRVVRDLEFDVAELAIVTFLMAKSAGVPLTLLPRGPDRALPASVHRLQRRSRTSVSGRPRWAARRYPLLHGDDRRMGSRHVGQ
jgi:hypothetical protein